MTGAAPPTRRSYATAPLLKRPTHAPPTDQQYNKQTQTHLYHAVPNYFADDDAAPAAAAPAVAAVVTPAPAALYESPRAGTRVAQRPSAASASGARHGHGGGHGGGSVSAFASAAGGGMGGGGAGGGGLRPNRVVWGERRPMRRDASWFAILVRWWRWRRATAAAALQRCKTSVTGGLASPALDTLTKHHLTQADANLNSNPSTQTGAALLPRQPGVLPLREGRLVFVAGDARPLVLGARARRRVPRCAAERRALCPAGDFETQADQCNTNTTPIRHRQHHTHRPPSNIQGTQHPKHKTNQQNTGVLAVLPYAALNAVHSHPSGSPGLPADDGLTEPDKKFHVRVLVPWWAKQEIVVTITRQTELPAASHPGVDGRL